jgi:hypothetical protein
MGNGTELSVLKTSTKRQVAVAHAYNLTYFGGWDQEDDISSLWDPISMEKKDECCGIHLSSQQWWGSLK